MTDTEAALIIALAEVLSADMPEAERHEHMRAIRDSLREQLQLPLPKEKP